MQYMTITRDQPASGGPERTERSEITALVRRQELAPLNIEAEPEDYLDASPSMMWPWKSNAGMCTWDIALGVLTEGLGPFAAMDSQASHEEAGGGVFCYPFSDTYLQMGENADDGDLNPKNVKEKVAAWIRRHWGRKATGPHPERGGTRIMSAIKAADDHFCLGDDAEFADRAIADRPLRIRRVLTDGILQDAAEFIAYLSQARLYVPPPKLPFAEDAPAWGDHGEWREVWAIAILGEDSDGAAKAAYDQYMNLKARFPWIHPYFFQKVSAVGEIAEDFAMATVPQDA